MFIIHNCPNLEATKMLSDRQSAASKQWNIIDERKYTNKTQKDVEEP